MTNQSDSFVIFNLSGACPVPFLSRAVEGVLQFYLSFVSACSTTHDKNGAG